MTVQGWTYTDTLGNTSSLPLTDCVQIIGPGDYELFGIYESNCTVIHTYHVEQDCGGVGLNETSEIISEVQIYPNPTSHQLTIATDLAINEISIIDITGKTVKTIKENTNTINVADLPTGIYFIQFITDEKTITKKLVKQ
jgi:hypothetical protein